MGWVCVLIVQPAALGGRALPGSVWEGWSDSDAGEKPEATQRTVLQPQLDKPTEGEPDRSQQHAITDWILWWISSWSGIAWWLYYFSFLKARVLLSCSSLRCLLSDAEALQKIFNFAEASLFQKETCMQYAISTGSNWQVIHGWLKFNCVSRQAEVSRKHRKASSQPSSCSQNTESSSTTPEPAHESSDNEGDARRRRVCTKNTHLAPQSAMDLQLCVCLAGRLSQPVCTVQ